MATKLDTLFYDIEARTTGLDLGVAEAKRKIDTLQGKSVDVPITVDPAPAEQGAKRVTKALDDTQRKAEAVGASAKASGKEFADAFTSSALGVGIATASIVGLGAALVKVADDYQMVNGRLKLVTNGTDELAAVQDRLGKIANGSFQAFGATADLYSRIARNSKQLGLSQEELFQTTEAVSQAVRLSGVSAAAAEAGLIQLGQAFASGTLRGDELRSVLEQLPRLAEAIASGLGVTVGELRKLGEEGRLTSADVARAIGGQLGALNAEAAQLGPTLGQSLTVFKNAVGDYINDTNEATGATAALARGVTTLAENFDLIAGAAAVAGAVYVGKGLGPMIEANGRLAVATALNVTESELQAAALSREAVAAQAAAVATAEKAAATIAALEADRALVAAEMELAIAAQRVAAAEAIAADGTNASAIANARLAETTQAVVILGGQQQAIARGIAAAEATRAEATAVATAATTAGGTAMGGAAASAGLLSRALGLLGGPVGAAITVTMLAIAAAVGQARKAKEEAEKATRDYITSLQDLSKAELQAERDRKVRQRDGIVDATGGQPEARRLARTTDGLSIKDLDAQIATLDNRIATVSKTARKAAAEAAADTKQAIDNAKERNRIQAESGELAAEAFSKAAASFKDAAGESRSFAQALRDGDPAAKAAYASTLELVTLDKQFSESKKGVTKAVKEATAAQKEFERTSKKLDDLLRDIGEKSDKNLKTEKEKNATLTAFQRAQADKIAQLQRENAAIKDGEVAYARYLSNQRLIEAGARAVAEAKRIDANLTEAQAEAIRKQAVAAEQLLIANENAKNKGGKPPEPPKKDEIEALVSGISTALGAAQGLASAFGNVGEAVADAAGKAENLVSALNRARDLGKITGADGKGTKDVGFSGALKGQAGAAQFLSAAGTGLAVVGALKGLGDAVDIFGTKAKQRAKEIAEATKAFNEGLTKLRDRADGTGSSVADEIDASLREYADLIAAANKAFKGDALDREKARAGAVLDRDRARIAADALADVDDALAKLSGNDVAARLRDAQRAADEQANGFVALRKAGIITQEQEAEAIAKVRRIFELTKEQIEAAAAEAEAAKQFDAASREFAARARLFEIEGLAYVAGLVKITGERFPELAGILTGIDVSTADGLATLKDRAKAIFDALAADGLTEAEQKIVDAMFDIIDAAEAAGPALKTFADKVNDALASIGRDNDILGGDATTRFGRTADAAKALAPQLAAILGDVDLSSTAGIDAVKAKLRTLYTTLLVDGISDEESPIVDLIRSLLGGLDDVLAESEDAADTVRDRARERSRAIIDAFDLEGGDAFGETLRGYGDAFESLFGTFDVSTVDGVNAAKEAVRNLIIGIQNGTADLSAFGDLTGDEIIGILLDLDGSLDGLGDSAADAARAVTDFVTDLNVEFLNATGQGLEAVKLQTELWVDSMIAQAEKLGVATPENLEKIRAIGRNRIKEAEEREAAKTERTTRDTLRDARETRAEVGRVLDGETTAQRVSSISEISAQSVVGYLASSYVEQRAARVVLEQIAGLLSVAAPTVAALPPGASVGGGGFAVQITVNVTGPITGQTATDAGRQIADAILPYVNTQLARAAGIEATLAGTPFS